MTLKKVGIPGAAVLVSIGCITFNIGAQEVLPRGTIIPVRLTTSVSSQKTKPGQEISGRIMQDVPLPDGTKLKEGARVTGQVVDLRPASQTVAARVSLVFDRLVISKKTLSIVTILRALASPGAVESAQIPTSGMGCGDTWESRTTVQIGGDVVYWGGGPVDNSTGPVGEPVTGTTGVLVRVTAKPGSPCQGDVGQNQGPQALWVFSSDACGIYGLVNASLDHAGRTQPSGVIQLVSKHGDLKIPSGSGLLLRVIAASK
jgi:hypothetical protein